MDTVGDVLPAELLDNLGLQPVAALGGRLNRHWLVEQRGERRVLRRWTPLPAESIEYERTLVAHLAQMGWPVAPLSEPTEVDGRLWSLADELQGSPRAASQPGEPRERGRLLARFHRDTATIQGLKNRPGWRRCEEILADPEIDRRLAEHKSSRENEVATVRWHLERARQLAADLPLQSAPPIPIHGDFTSWNLLFQGEELTGLYDFELSRNDHRVADFALSWRGKYDEVIAGYEEISPLEPWERSAIVPVLWAELIEAYDRNLRLGQEDDGWVLSKLTVRSEAMAPYY